jgi:hypothetical protein
MNVVASRGGIDGAPIASVCIWDNKGSTQYRALHWVRMVMKECGVELVPERCTSDDDGAAHLAILAVWPGCQIQYVLLAFRKATVPCSSLSYYEPTFCVSHVFVPTGCAHGTFRSAACSVH